LDEDLRPRGLKWLAHVHTVGRKKILNTNPEVLTVHAMCIPLSDDEEPSQGEVPKSGTSAFPDPPLALAVLPPRALWWDFPGVGLGWVGEDLLHFCANPAKGTDSMEAKRALSSVPVHPAFGQDHS